MKLERSIFQQSYFYFFAFFIFVVTGFWITYFTHIAEQPNYRMHTHGATLLLWCLMLISQAYLIRTNKRDLHKLIGKLSYVLVPLMVFTTLDLLKYRLSPAEQLGTTGYFSVALVVNALIAFVIFYGLAIYHRKKSLVHARYMICTIFPMFTPVTDRIIHIHFPSILPYLYTIEGAPQAPVVGFIMADLILLALCIWDWRSHRRWNVFPFALLVLVCYHLSVFTFYKFQFWRSFSEWFVHL